MPDARPLPRGVALIGAGKMGRALLDGWLARGLDAPATCIIEPNPDAALRALCVARGVSLNPEAPHQAAVLVLAVKPQSLADVAQGVSRLIGPGTLVLSVLAGKTIADLAARLPAASIVRAMPNLPASVGRGATGAVASPSVTAAQRDAADALLACAGIVEWVEDEALIDAVTAVSGSGPAYVALLAEALAEAGIAAGLPAGIAGRLARATVSGTGALLDTDPREPGQLRRDVTSPGGTTAAALDVLMQTGGLPDLVTRAVTAAKRRAGELSG